MSNLDPKTRHRLAAFATACYAGELEYAMFLSKLPEIDRDEDDAVTELLDLIEREPARGRFLGLPPAEHEAYVADIRRRIAELAADAPEIDRAI
jgi:hypothetical protein